MYGTFLGPLPWTKVLGYDPVDSINLQHFVGTTLRLVTCIRQMAALVILCKKASLRRHLEVSL